MRPGKRHGHKLGRFSDPKALADSLPEHLRNPNGVGRWPTLDEHRRAVADYLRTVGISQQLAPDVAAATGVAICILMKSRQLGEPHAT